MSKSDWFDAFEEAERENPDATEDQLNAIAESIVVSRYAAKADELVDRAKYERLTFVDKCRGFAT